MLSTPALLAAPNKREAAELKAKGDRAMDEARPADALAAYERSYAIQPEPALLYNQARAHLALTNYPAALDYLQRFETQAPASLKAKLPGLDALVREVRGKVHTLTVTVNVPSATVRLRDATLGESPLPAGLKVNAGAATLDVRAPGYEPMQRNLQLAGDAESTERFELQRIDVRGTLVLRSPQTGVRAVVQNRWRGGLPLELTLPQGTYPIELSKDGYETMRTSVVVVAGERRERKLVLAKTPALYTRWWFWTALGVVAAGGVVTIVALTTEKSPETGTIPPGQLANGLSF